MIRDKYKIYGEKNDPNTVLATGILEDNKLVVGSGYKGIKTYQPLPNSILFVENGELKNISYREVNKVLGTDFSGNLTWHIKPAETVIVDSEPVYFDRSNNTLRYAKFRDDNFGLQDLELEKERYAYPGVVTSSVLSLFGKVDFGFCPTNSSRIFKRRFANSVLLCFEKGFELVSGKTYNLSIEFTVSFRQLTKSDVNLNNQIYYYKSIGEKAPVLSINNCFSIDTIELLSSSNLSKSILLADANRKIVFPDRDQDDLADDPPEYNDDSIHTVSFATTVEVVGDDSILDLVRITTPTFDHFVYQNATLRNAIIDPNDDNSTNRDFEVGVSSANLAVEFRGKIKEV